MTQEPTYLFCVGATKAGTSWLYDHLAAHPDCHFRSIKELHYFSMTEPKHFDAALRNGQAEIADLKARTGLVGEAKFWADRRLADLRDWQKVLRARAIDLPAYRAFLGDGAKAARLVGDVTPAYALMPAERLQTLSDVGADVRVVYLIRDPVARLWSHVRMIAQRMAPQRFAEESCALLDRILSGDLSGEGKGIVARGNYATILPKLAKVFAPQRLLVQFYEDLISAPGVARLAEFLGLSARTADVARLVHEGRSLALAAPLRARARAFLRPQYDYVASQFGDLPAAWRANMQEGFA